MPRLYMMRLVTLATLVAAAVLFASPPAAHAQTAPIYHGTLKIRPARGGIDKDHGDGSLRVNNWDLLINDESNGIAPDREPIIIAMGDTERLVIAAGDVHASRNGRKFTYRNPEAPRGIRFLQMRQLKDPAGAKARYRIRFALVGIDLSALLIEFPVCKAMAIIIGDDDGFSGVDLDRPGGFNRSLVRVMGACQAESWPWT